MKHATSSESELTRILWKRVWDKANETTGVKRKKKEIVETLAAQLDMGPSTIWKYHVAAPEKINNDTKELLATYLGYKSFDDFSKGIKEEKEQEGAYAQTIQEEMGDDPFLQHIYDELARIPKHPDHIFEAESGPVFFSFIKSLRKTYNNEEFTTINLLPDTNRLFGSLPMDGEFVQLSYITQMDARSRESVIRNETELNKVKIRRSIETSQKLSKDYILNFRFNSINQLLVLGSPGIGKSTFSHWLCYEWGNGHRQMNKVPVYIQLKHLDFKSGHNAIAHYLYRYYMTSFPVEKGHLYILDFLRKTGGTTCLILDGYDELSEENKQHLYAAILEISPTCKYILTSRPYGVLNTYGLDFTETIQLDGLDLPNIHRYIDNFLQKDNIPVNKNKHDLLNIININPTLTDFAHNPLMLSFMVVIYLSDINAEEALKGIQSRFDLQDAVIGWMFEHNMQKAHVVPNEQLHDNIAAAAYRMEINKLHEQTCRLDNPETHHVLKPIAMMGIGQLIKQSAATSKFHFNSITFQEYFTAKWLNKRITPDAFAYLLRDSYFWNLCAMLIGSLADNEQAMDTLQLLIDTEENNVRKNGRDQDYYRYILLLSECKSRFLGQYLDAGKLDHVYNAFRLNHENDLLKYAVGECLQRLYHKIGYHHRILFKDIIIRELSSSWKIDHDHLAIWNRQYNHIDALTEILELKNDTDFLYKVAPMLKDPLTDLNKSDDIAEYYFGLPETLLNIIIAGDTHATRFNTGYHNMLRTIDELLPETQIKLRARIQAFYTTTDDALYDIADNIHYYRSAVTWPEKDRIIGKLITAMSIVSKAVSTYIILPLQDAKKQHFENATAILTDYLKERWELEFGAEEQEIDAIYDYFVLLKQTASLLLESDNTDEAIELLILSQETVSFSLNVKAQSQVFGYFQDLIDNTTEANLTAHLNDLTILIHSISALKNAIAQHRDKIAELVDSYIEQHKDAFEMVDKPYYNGIGNGNKETAELKLEQAYDTVSKILPFVNMLSDRNEEIYETDKRFFLDKLIEKERDQLTYLKTQAFKDILSHDLNIYDQKYWDFIFSCLDKNNHVLACNAMRISTNPSIYKYAINMERIRRVLEFIQTKRDDEVFLEKAYNDIIPIIARTLLMIKTNDDGTLKFADMVNITGSILQSPFLKTKTLENITYWFDSEQAAYILQYYYTGDKYFNLKINYAVAFEHEKSKTNLIEDLYDAFVRKGKLEAVEMERLKKVTGAKFHGLFLSHHERMTTFNFPFNKDFFEERCKF